MPNDFWQQIDFEATRKAETEYPRSEDCHSRLIFEKAIFQLL